MTSLQDNLDSNGPLNSRKAVLLHVARLLGSMGLNQKGKTVLDVGAGTGDSTRFWVDRGAMVTATDTRKEHVDIIRERFPDITSFTMDIDQAEDCDVPPHEIVYAYGIFDRLKDPARAIASLSQKCTGVMLLEARVSYGEGLDINLGDAPASSPSRATSSLRCRPTRHWVFAELKKHFPYVYQPSYQPDDPQFPTDWSRDTEQSEHLSRTTFIASRRPINASTFFPRVLDRQTRQAKREAIVEPGLDGILARADFGLVLDVGANQGQFARKMRDLGYFGPIASFEPMQEAFRRLSEMAKQDEKLTVFNTALGATNEAREIFISGNSASSSFLQIEDMTVSAEPLTSVVGTETVQIQRLDDIAEAIFAMRTSGPVLLKLDTQGYEREVLEGATETLSDVDYVLAECSLVSVYEGEPLIEEQIAWLRQRGFVPIALERGWSDQVTGQAYQTDILFQRNQR